MHGYVGPVKGADEHWSYRFDEGQEILLDLPANEWHFVLDGVVIQVGRMDDMSLENFLKDTPITEDRDKTEREEKNKEFRRSKIEEPYNANVNTMGTSPSSMG
jgi:hypothetical protein